MAGVTLTRRTPRTITRTPFLSNTRGQEAPSPRTPATPSTPPPTVYEMPRPPTPGATTPMTESPLYVINFELSVEYLDARASREMRILQNTQYAYEKTRVMVRLCGVNYVPFEHLLTEGLARHIAAPEGDNAEGPRKRARRDDDDPYVIYGDNVFAQALAHFPGFADNVDVLDSRPELIGRLARYLKTVAGKVRSDDYTRIRDVILAFAGIEDRALMSKQNRRWNSEATAAMLVPLAQLQEFRRDPAQFCRDVRNGQIAIKTADFGAWLYDLDQVDLDDIAFKSGLLESPVLFKAGAALLHSPRSVLENDTLLGEDHRRGQPSVARRGNITAVTYAMIVYFATLARHAFTSVSEWSDVDGAWSAPDFTDALMRIGHKSPRWRAALVTRWNQALFNPIVDEEADKDSALARLLNEEAEPEEDQEPSGSGSRASEDEDLYASLEN